MTINGSEYHRFSVTAGETYEVYWNDSYQGNSTKTLDIRASAYYETSEVSIFSGVDSGYTTPQVFTAASNGNVIIRIYPYSSGSIGTYAVKYNTVAVTVVVDTVTVDPPTASVAKGGTQTFSATVTGTGSPAQTVTWTVSGNNYMGTTISDGVLNVAANETATSLTVRATSTVDTSKFGTAAITVTVPATVTPVTVDPATASVVRGGTQIFSATVAGTGNPAQTVTWGVSGNSHSGTTISATGLLTVAAGETATSLTVRATSTVDTAKSGTATVTVTIPITVSTVTVDPATVNVANGGTQTFSATVAGTGNPAQTVTWTVSGNNRAGTTINAAGALNVAANETATSLTVRATSTVDTAKFGTAVVTVTVPVTVNISLWVNQDGSILTPNSAVVLSKGIGGHPASFTTTVTGEYTDVQWYLYGDPVYGSRGTAQSIRVNAADFAYGTYALGVTVTKDSVPYSTEIRFTVSY
jgi:hypothetical protein